MFISFHLVASLVAQAVRNPPAMLPRCRSTWVRSLGWENSWGGYGNWLQYSCLENPMDRGDMGHGTEETGGLLGLQRVGDNWATNRSTAVTNALSKHTGQPYLSSLSLFGASMLVVNWLKSEKEFHLFQTSLDDNINVCHINLPLSIRLCS